MRQKRLLLRLRLGDQRAAMAVGGCEEAPGHVVAEKRNCRGVTPVRHCESAADAGAVLRIGERRLRAAGNVRQIDTAVRVDSRRATAVDAAAVDHAWIGDPDVAAYPAPAYRTQW